MTWENPLDTPQHIMLRFWYEPNKQHHLPSSGDTMNATRNAIAARAKTIAKSDPQQLRQIARNVWESNDANVRIVHRRSERTFSAYFLGRTDFVKLADQFPTLKAAKAAAGAAWDQVWA